MRAKIQDYVDGYELYDHVLHAGRNPRRMADLGLTDYAIDRWALAGAPRDWIARIEQLAERGASKLWIGVNGADLDAQRAAEADGRRDPAALRRSLGRFSAVASGNARSYSAWGPGRAGWPPRW